MAESEMIDADFARRNEVQPFPVSSEDIDLDSDFIKELCESLQAGYDPSRPIVLAKGSKEIQGLVIDGKHRLIALHLLEKKGITVNATFTHENIRNMEHYRARVAHFITKSRSKDGRLARAIVDRHIGAIVHNHFDKNQEQLSKYISGLGFKNEVIVAKLIFKEKEKRNVKKVSKPTPQAPTFTDTKESWGIASNTYGLKAGESLDLITNYRECPDCKSPLAIVTDEHGRVVKVQHANPPIAK